MSERNRELGFDKREADPAYVLSFSAMQLDVIFESMQQFLARTSMVEARGIAKPDLIENNEYARDILVMIAIARGREEELTGEKGLVFGISDFTDDEVTHRLAEEKHFNPTYRQRLIQRHAKRVMEKSDQQL